MPKDEVVVKDGANVDYVAHPPEGWTVTIIPNVSNLTLEYLCSSVDGDVFRTSDKNAVSQHITDIETAKKVQPTSGTSITSDDVAAFGAAFAPAQ